MQPYNPFIKVYIAPKNPGSEQQKKASDKIAQEDLSHELALPDNFKEAAFNPLEPSSPYPMGPLLEEDEEEEARIIAQLPLPMNSPLLAQPILQPQPMISNHPNIQILDTVDPSQFRSNKYSIYMPAFIDINHTLINNYGPVNELVALLQNNMNYFFPDTISTHPIHGKLSTICTNFFSAYESQGLFPTIKECKKFISDVILHSVPGECWGDEFSHWPNRVKARCEILEVALRSHLFPKMLLRQKAQINEHFKEFEKFPENMAEIESELFNFATLNGFHNNDKNPFLDCAGKLSSEILNLKCKECISNVPDKEFNNINVSYHEKLISEKLKELQLEKPSYARIYLEWLLRQNLKEKMMAKQIEIFRDKFQKEGVLTLTENSEPYDDILRASFRIHSFYVINGNNQNSYNITEELLIDTFAMDLTKSDPFAEAFRINVLDTNFKISKALKEKEDETNSWSSLFSRQSKIEESYIEKEKQITALSKRQQDTLINVKTSWNDLLAPRRHEPLPPRTSNKEISTFELVDLGKNGDPAESSKKGSLSISTLPPRINTQSSSGNTFNIEFKDIDFEQEIKKEKPSSKLFDNAKLIDDYKPNGGQPSSTSTTSTTTTISTTTTQPVRSKKKRSKKPSGDLKTKVVGCYHPSDLNIPLISYIDRHWALAEILSTTGSDLDIWQRLPVIVQKDALRHCTHYGYKACSGKAEGLAYSVFGTMSDKLGQGIRNLYPMRLNPIDVGLTQEFIDKGEELLDLYYSGNLHGFMQKLAQLPEEERFLKHVYKMAEAAGVKVLPGDSTFAKNNWEDSSVLKLTFAKNNWKEIGMLKLTVQALEKCLHTPKSIYLNF